MLLFSNQLAPTWDEPIDMLYACHSKVKRFCQQLSLLPDYLTEHGLTDEIRQTIWQIQQYFNQAAPLHHQDEELDFFPTLLKYAPQAQPDIDMLNQQHIVLHDTWAKLCTQINQLLNRQCQHIDPALINQFTQAYAKHISIEEPLFDLGKKVIPQQQQQAIGKIMAQRRQIANHS